MPSQTQITGNQVKDATITPVDLSSSMLYNITSSWANNSATATSSPLYLPLAGGNLTGRLGLINITASQGATFVGNVGIGMTNPGSKLELNSGNISLFRGQTVTGTSMIGMSDADGYMIPGSSWWSGMLINSTTGASYLSFYTSPANYLAGAEVMRIDKDGNVGIGTVSPGKLLHVQGEISCSAITGTTFSGKAANSGLLNSYAYTYFQPALTNTLYNITAAMATTTPYASNAGLLNTHADTYFQPALTNTLYNITAAYASNATTAVLYLPLAGGNLTGLLGLEASSIEQEMLRFSYTPDATNYHVIKTRFDGGTSTNNYLDFEVQSAANNTSSVLFLRGDGYVGIGTKNPQKLLHVQGEISSSNIYVNGNNSTTGSLCVTGSILLNTKTYASGAYSFAKYVEVIVGATAYKIPLYS